MLQARFQIAYDAREVTVTVVLWQCSHLFCHALLGNHNVQVQRFRYATCTGMDVRVCVWSTGVGCAKGRCSKPGMLWLDLYAGLCWPEEEI